MKIAILVVDSNEVAADVVGHLALPSPVVHPAMQAQFDAFARRNDHEYFVLYGKGAANAAETRQCGAVTYIGVPAPNIAVPGIAKGYLGRFLALRKYLRSLNPDVVHAQGTERESGMVAVHSGFPSVLTLHGNFRELKKIYRPKPFSYGAINAHLETHVLKRVDAIICISRYVREITREFGRPQFLIPNPVRPEFLVEPRPVGRNRPPRVCCMGVIDERKRTKFILQACERLWQQGLEFTLHVYGNPAGTYGEEMRRVSESWVRAGKVFFEGYTGEPLRAIVSSDVMVTASVEESFGMNVLEAMAAGTPVVAPKVGGILDIVEDGVSGLLYDVDNLAACSAHIHRFLMDATAWDQISRAGRARAAKHFAPEVVARQTVEAYEKVAADR